jgi:hypothetical protein
VTNNLIDIAIAVISVPMPELGFVLAAARSAQQTSAVFRSRSRGRDQGGVGWSTPGIAGPMFGLAAGSAEEPLSARQAAAQAEIDELITLGKLALPRSGASMDELAREVQSLLHPISVRYRVEIGAWIFEDGKGGLVIRSVHVGDESTVPALDRPPTPLGAQGAIHTHWNDALLSDNDLTWVHNRQNDPPGPRLPLYVSRGGKVYACDPGSARCNDGMIDRGVPGIQFRNGRFVGNLSQ